MPYKDKEKRKEYDRKRYQRLKEKRLKQAREWREKNRDKDLQNKKKYYENNKEYLNEINKKYYRDNREQILQKDKQHKIDNNEHYREYRRKRYQYRYKNDINFYLKKVLKSRMNQALKHNYITGVAVENLGCSIEELKKHLESQFQEGMSWDNKGKWHIDHIIPLSSFDLSDPSELKKACHYGNLQPLWAKDNIIKSNKEM